MEDIRRTKITLSYKFQTAVTDHLKSKPLLQLAFTLQHNIGQGELGAGTLIGLDYNVDQSYYNRLALSILLITFFDSSRLNNLALNIIGVTCPTAIYFFSFSL